MSKVLKFIVHFVVICTLICVLGLVLPPFFGVRTVIVDKSDKATNLPVGSVTYAIPEKSSAISAGTPILVQKDSETYKYTITNLDASKGTGTVTDQSVSGGKTFTIKVGDYVPKVVVTIGYVGYLMVATESIEGLIILGLVVLFLIILYVIAELWKKEPDDIEEDVNDPEPGYVKSRKELKQEEKARARRMKEEEKEIIQEEKARKHKNKKADKRKVRTGGFVDERMLQAIRRIKRRLPYSRLHRLPQVKLMRNLRKRLQQPLQKKQICFPDWKWQNVRLKKTESRIRPERSKRFRKRKRSRLPLEALRCRLIPQRSLQAA